MIVSTHHYILRDEVANAEFEAAVAEAEQRGLFDLPGLVEYHFGKGVRGDRAGRYTAIWCYESEAAWADLWGPVGDPVPPETYPDSWIEWETELLDPLLVSDADDISFTSYRVLD